MTTVLITGASRGIGLELARQYAADGDTVLATCRHPDNASDLSELAARSTSMRVLPLDVTDSDSVQSLARELDGVPIDILINNAGISGPREAQTLGTFDFEAWADVFDTNVLGVMRVTEALLPNLLAGELEKLVTISSVMGSISENGGGHHLYRSSKAAINSSMKGLSIELAKKGVTVLILHPGWVRTDMGGPSATLSPTDSAEGIRRVISGASPSQSGQFRDWKGEQIPW